MTTRATLTALTTLSNPTKLTDLTTLTISTDQKKYQEDKCRIRIAYFALFAVGDLGVSSRSGWWHDGSPHRLFHPQQR